VGQLSVPHRGDRRLTRLRKRFMYAATRILFHPGAEAARFLPVAPCTLSFCNHPFSERIQKQPELESTPIPVLELDLDFRKSGTRSCGTANGLEHMECRSNCQPGSKLDQHPIHTLRPSRFLHLSTQKTPFHGFSARTSTRVATRRFFSSNFPTQTTRTPSLTSSSEAGLFCLVNLV
jgi:hypothetical protein